MLGDHVRLEQVLRNVIGNAIKYSPHHSSVSIALYPTATEARVIVQDEGIGIPASALPHVFQRFYRVASHATRTVNGFGIGLYIVKEIMMLHGGSISIDSAEGQGTTVTLCFPLQLAPVAS